MLIKKKINHRSLKNSKTKIYILKNKNGQMRYAQAALLDKAVARAFRL